MKALSKKWDHFWYDSFEASDLYNFRVLFYTFLSIYSLFFDRGNLSWLSLPPGFWQPVSVLGPLDGPISYEAGLILQTTFDISCVLCAVGLFFRFFSTVCFLSFFIIVSLTNSYGVALHDDLGIVIFLLILSCSNAHRGRSLDSLVFSTYFRESSTITWPIRLCQVMFGMLFFMAGLSKIHSSGIGWITGNSLRNYMIYTYYREALSPMAEKFAIGLWLAKFPVLCRTLSFTVLLLEIMGPFIGFLKNRLALALITLYGLMVVGFYFTVTDGFLNLLILFTCWLPLIRQLNESQSVERQGRFS